MIKRKIVLAILSFFILVTAIPFDTWAMESENNEYNKAESQTSLINKKRDYPKNFYKDVTSNAWYAQGVKVVYEYGVMNGYSNGSFGCNSNITIAEILTIASRINSTYTGNEIDTEYRTEKNQ